jgi:acetate kinase
LRARICRDAAWLGLEVDADANRGGAQRISRAGSRVSAFVVPTNEELMIARHTRDLLATSAKERTA